MNSHPTQQTSAITQLKILGNACNKQYIGEFEQPHSYNRPFHEGSEKI